MKTPKEKAKELIEKYLNLPINFPYIDTIDKQCIGSGYMTYYSAVKCAIIAVDEILDTLKKIPVEYYEIIYMQTSYWQSVKTELETLKN